MRNVIRGVLGGLAGALTGGLVFVVTWYATALLATPPSGAEPGLYLSLGLGTLCGILVGMGTRIRPGRAARLLSLSLGFGLAGLVVGHFGGRLVHWLLGEGAGSLEALGTVPEGARSGVWVTTIVGAVVGVLTGAATASGPTPEPGAAPAGTSGGVGEETAASTPKRAEAAGVELPRSRAPGADGVATGEHPADSMSVEELLGEDRSE